MAAYFAILNPGDTFMGMKLDHGGHLTHGHPITMSGKWLNPVSYGVHKDTETLDYEEIESLANEHKPKLIVAGASAYPRFFDFERLGKIAKSVGAKLMVDMAHIAGLVAAGIHPSPVPHADVVTTTTHKTLRGPRGGMILSTNEMKADIRKAVFPGIQGGPLMHVIAAKAVCFKEAQTEEFVEYQKQTVKNASALAKHLAANGFRIVSGGTDNHLMLVDLRPKDINGKEAEDLCESIGITVNKNAIPYDPAPPMTPSGMRLGTPSLTTRGMKEPEMEEVASIITKLITHRTDEKILEDCKNTVKELTDRFPLYGGMSYL